MLEEAIELKMLIYLLFKKRERNPQVFPYTQLEIGHKVNKAQTIGLTTEAISTYTS